MKLHVPGTIVFGPQIERAIILFYESELSEHVHQLPCTFYKSHLVQTTLLVRVQLVSTTYAFTHHRAKCWEAINLNKIKWHNAITG